MTWSTTKVGEYNVRLSAKFGEYNCGNKTTGRLALVVTKTDDDTTNYGPSVILDELKNPDIQKAIITVFLKDLDKSSNYTTLKDGAPFFENDTGKYTPGLLVYMDRITHDKGYTWYNNWKGLMEHFETHPEFGVVVLKSPILPNRFYGTSAPSRVWMVVLPTISKHIALDKDHISTEMKNALLGLKKSKQTSALLDEELKQLGVA